VADGRASRGRGELVVWNRTAARAGIRRAAQGAGGRHPRALAAAVEVVVTCLPTSRDVEALLGGPTGLASLHPGTLFLDCTSGDPGLPAGWQRARAAGVAFADAPVRGHQRRRRGPSPSWWGRRRHLRAPAGARGVRQPDRASGSGRRGHAMKAVNNALLAINILSVGEALATLVKAGVPAGQAAEVLNGSSGRTFVSESLVPERVLTGRWPRTFRLALLAKDVGIARDLLRECGVEGPMIDLAGQLFQIYQAIKAEDEIPF
jgi:3-hydroxyisobutyrate dehydrogenase